MGKITKRELVLIIGLLLAIGAGLFGSLHYNRENRVYKRHIKELEKTNARNAVSIDSLKASVIERDKTDSILVEQIKELYITTTNESSNEILRMDADTFLIKFSAYIDSATRNLHH